LYAIAKLKEIKMTTKTLKEIRQRLGYDENDDSHDIEIAKMTIHQKMDAILGWHFGYSGWWSLIKNWLKECGHEIEE
jgi:hypothetical protein